MKDKVLQRRLSGLDLVLVCLFAAFALFVLSGLTQTSIWAALFTLLLFSLALLAYAHLIPVSDTDSRAPRKVPRDRDASLRQQALLADGFAEAVIIINRQERILYANPAAQSLFDLEEPGRSLSSLIRDPGVRGLVTDMLAGDKPDPVIYHVETPVERHIRVMGSPIMSDSEGKAVRRAIIVFYDITDIVRVNTMRADFLANASHELKTPVASLLGYIETLRGHAKDDPDAQETFLGIMQEQAERMQRLIDDLLSLRRIEMVEHIMPTETADLYLATRAAIESVKPLAKNRGVKVKYSGPKEMPVTGIQDELVQVVLNILDNALEFTPEGGQINLSMTEIPMWHPRKAFSEDPIFETAARRRIVVPGQNNIAYARLRIRDQGPGFARSHLPRLGERFYKVDGKIQRRVRGTGLGLAIVKHIVRRHRGGLLIETAEGAGTEFTILIPLPDDVGGEPV